MKYYILIPFSVVVLFFSSCASNQYMLRNDAEIETLSVCVEYGEFVLEPIIESLEAALDHAIIDFNSKPNKLFKTDGCVDPDYNALNIFVEATTMVEQSQQTLATVGNVVGLFILPYAMVAGGAEFFIFFWLNPQVRSYMHLSFSEDLRVSKEIYPLAHLTSGYLRSVERQSQVHGNKFKPIFLLELNKIHNSYRKNLNKNKNVIASP